MYDFDIVVSFNIQNLPYACTQNNNYKSIQFLLNIQNFPYACTQNNNYKSIQFLLNNLNEEY